MRMVFGVLSLVILLAVIGTLAKRQLQAVQAPVGMPETGASAPPLSSTPAQQSEQLQRKMVDDIGKAFEQGAQRNSGASEQ